MIDAGKAMDILRSVIVLVDMEPALRRDKEAAADAAITAAARILTASSAARCNIKKIRVSTERSCTSCFSFEAEPGCATAATPLNVNRASPRYDEYGARSE